MYWEETHIVQVVEGVFSVVLGETTGLGTLSGAEEYWLQIEVLGDSPMQRIKFTSVPYAMTARQLDQYLPGNTTLDIPISNGVKCSNLNSDKLDGYDAGNAAGQIPLNNGTLNSTLNADRLDGLNADAFADTAHSHGSSELTNEPGAAGDGDTNSVQITTSYTTLAFRTLNAPSSGFALVLGTAEFSLENANGADASLTIGVTKTAGDFTEDADPVWLLPDQVADYGARQVITVQRLFGVSQGENDFYFQAFTGNGNDIASAKNRYLSIVFLPTNYGLVE
jgi:hypothetical protein